MMRRGWVRWALAALATCLLLQSCEPTSPPVLAEAVSVAVTSDGLYRVTWDELAAAGFRPAESVRAGLVVRQGEAVVPSTVDALGVVFWGQGPRGRYAAATHYAFSLAANAPAGARMTSVAPAADAACGVERLWRTTRVETNTVYWPKAARAVAEPWFGPSLRPRRPISVDVQLPFPVSDFVSPTLTVALWGTSEDAQIAPDHHVRVTANDVMVADVQWDGQRAYSQTVSLADVKLSAISSFRLETVGDTGLVIEQAYLDWVELGFWAKPALVRVFDAPTLGAYDGVLPRDARTLVMPEGDFVVYDVSDPAAPVLLEMGTACGQRVVEARVAGARLAVVPEQRYDEVSAVAPLHGPGGRAPQLADEVVIAADVYVAALAPLVAARQAEGLRVVVVPLSAIAAEFGDGGVDPETVRAFLRHTQKAWTAPAPRYALLVGDASYDYKGYLGPQRGHNDLPTFVVPAEYTGETISDEPYADLDGDGLPDLAVGRWPVETVAQVEQLVARTVAYSNAPAGEWRTRALFIADPSEKEFASRSDQMITRTNLSDTYSVVRAYTPDVQVVLDAWNSGVALVNYTGHGSLTLWGKDGLMSLEEVARLETAGGGPLVLTLTCLSGFYAHPEEVSLGEALLWTPKGGAIAVVSATSLTLADDQEPFGRALLNGLQASETARLGDAFIAAKRTLSPALPGQRDVINTFGLLGDPALKVLH